jgi:hypothetical protein
MRMRKKTGPSRYVKKGLKSEYRLSPVVVMDLAVFAQAFFIRTTTYDEAKPY